MTTKVSLFITNYRRELRIGIDIRRKEKMEKTTEFAVRMKRVQVETGVTLKKAQEEMKRQADRGRKKTEVWKVEDRIMLSTKDLVFKKRLAKKLVDQYIDPYIIDKIVFTHVIKLQLPTSIRIYLVVNISWVVCYKEQMKEQKLKEVKEWEVEKY